MPGFKLLKGKSGATPMIWMSLSGLLLLGVISTGVDWMQLSTREALRANDTGQRAVIDPQTGAVALHAIAAEDVAAFDVSDAPAAETPAEAPAATPADEKLPDGLAPLRTEPLPTALPAVSDSKESLITAPAPEVTENVQGLTLPKRNAKTTPATLYAKRFTRTPEQRLLSIVVMDAGISAQSLPLIMALPNTVTVAFSPYAVETAQPIARLRRSGFELWGMLPAMSSRYPQDDPGPLGLVASLPADELLRRLRAVMHETLGSVGLVLAPDEALTEKPDAFSPILAEVDARGLNVLTTHPTHTATQVAGKAELHSVVRRADLFLDPVPDEAAITQKLATISKTLTTQDTLVVVTTARPQTLLLLQRWLKEHPLEAPVVLAPLSAQWLPKEAPPPPVVEEKKGGHH